MPRALPKVLFIRLDSEGYPEAYSTIADAIEDDGPTRIGRYELVIENTARKVVKEGD